MRKRILALTLALSLLLTACSGGVSAATMHLRKTEGTVGVSDGDGKDVTPRDDLGLYSGYGVDTSSESYAWIDLDEVKLTKLDQDSEIAITKEGKKLEIEVKSGSLFFNVTEPLADDESMNIRTSTMIIGIRGTCGWVTQDTAALLEGAVEVTAGEQAVTISAGEMAVLTADRMLEVVAFSDQDIPDFVQDELTEDEELAGAIEDASGIDINASAITDAMHLRDMYTYSKSSFYSQQYADEALTVALDPVLVGETEYFPDEQGRIGRAVSRVIPDDGSWSADEPLQNYIYNDVGELQRIEDDSGRVIATVTENTADHRTWVYESGNFVSITYYDDQGRSTREEYFSDDGNLESYSVPTYDTDGKLIREDIYYSPTRLVNDYTLFEYN